MSQVILKDFGFVVRLAERVGGSRQVTSEVILRVEISCFRLVSSQNA